MRPRFRALTINTWLLRLPFGVNLAPAVEERARLLPSLVKSTGADIVFCQEVWDPKHRRQLREAFAREGYPYETSAAPQLGETFPSLAPGHLASVGLMLPFTLAASGGDAGTGSLLALGGSSLAALAAGSIALDQMRKKMGNGLQIFSRFPLSSKTDVMHFSTWTRHDEVFIAKGAIHTQVQLPSLGWVDLYNSHLGAVSYDGRTQSYDADQCRNRLQQAGELARWIEKTRVAEFALLGVDLNAAPEQCHGGETRPTGEYALLGQERGGLFQDTFRAGAAADEKGATDDSRNPYKNSGHFRGSPDVRIDYLFASPSPKVRTVGSRVVFDRPLSESLPAAGKLPPRISDHYGVLSEFEVA